LNLCDEKVGFYIQDLSFQRNIFEMERNTFNFVPAMLGMGWYNPKLEDDSEPLLVLCFEVKSSHQSMEQTRECHKAPFGCDPRVQLCLHHMPWCSSEAFVHVVNRDLMPIYAGVERGGEVRFGAFLHPLALPHFKSSCTELVPLWLLGTAFYLLIQSLFPHPQDAFAFSTVTSMPTKTK
jgi:hypothetical protein